jgi:DNA repair protein RadA/Sms
LAKTKTSYFCQSCGYESPKWLGRCPSCNAWNSIIEETVQKEPSVNQWRGKKSDRVPRPTPLQQLAPGRENRILTPDQELNRVLGGGIVPGSLVLIGGEPGIGKSTLMLQLALSLPGQKILYISGEESEQQLKMRADRLVTEARSDCSVLTETNTQTLFTVIEEHQPSVIIVDSIQTLYSGILDSPSGSIAQVRQCAGELMRFTKETNTPVFLIGHITKDGTLAGPKVLEHMVDTVLQFEGDRHLAYRILRTTKNRFGSTSEIGIYEMLTTGLREVSNPSEILISQKDVPISGVTIGAMLEGNRPLLIEIQSLVSPASYGTPQRSSTGFDQKRLNMLLAVLEKRCGFRISAQDVFLNIAGGIRVEDPAIDLALCVSVASAFEDIAVPDHVCMASEVGLGGELRAVNRIDQRISEAEKLGFKTIYVSRYNMKGVDKSKGSIEIKAFGKLTEVFQDLWG